MVYIDNSNMDIGINVPKIPLWGCNGLDGDICSMDSEPGGHQPVSKVKTFIKYKS